MEDIKLDESQEAAVAAMLAGKNVFLTGSAGTGKTAVVKSFLAKCKRRIATVAPTGVAAINAGGSTIHSFFALPIGLITQDTLQPLKWKGVRTKIQTADAIIIDEISMVRSDLLWAIDHRCRECAKRREKKLPFGGKQIVAVGDFFQLPPVVSDPDENLRLCLSFGGEYAFCSDTWREANFEIFFLKTQYRQDADAEFTQLLEKLRRADSQASCSELLSRLNGQCAIRGKKLPSKPTRLCTTNREAQLINDYFRQQLTGEPRVYEARVSGKFGAEDFPTEPKLELKAGCRVMALRNKKRQIDGSFEYANGECGTVLRLGDRWVDVQFDSGTESRIEPHVWQKCRYQVSFDQTGRRILDQIPIGSFEQLPLKLAYAVTIHKSQGMTLQSVELRLGKGCFAPGQLYTALSRVKSVAGLRLQRPAGTGDMVLDQRVLNFYRAIEREPVADVSALA